MDAAFLQQPKPRMKRKRRTLRDFHEHASGLTDEEFRRFYRVTRPRFEWLCRKLIHLKPKRKRKDWLSVEVKLAITLRFLAGGSYLDIKEMWGIRTNTFYDTVHVVLQEINIMPYPDCPTLNEILEMPEPKKSEQLAEISVEFAALAKGVFVGCVGCIDGLCIKVQRPDERRVSNPSKFYNRKGFFALSMQGICDARRRIRSASIICPGTTTTN